MKDPESRGTVAEPVCAPPLFSATSLADFVRKDSFLVKFPVPATLYPPPGRSEFNFGEIAAKSRVPGLVLYRTRVEMISPE